MHTNVPVVSGNCISRIRVWDSNGEQYDQKFVVLNKNRIDGRYYDKPISKFAKVLYPLPAVFRIKRGIIILKTSIGKNSFYEEFPIDTNNPSKTYNEVMDYFYNVFFYATLGKPFAPKPKVSKCRDFIFASFISRKTFNFNNIQPTGNSFDNCDPTRNPYLLAVKYVFDFLKSDPETVEDALMYNCKPAMLDEETAQKLHKAFPYKKVESISKKVGACQLSVAELEPLLEICNGNS